MVELEVSSCLMSHPLLPTTSYPTRSASVLASTNYYTNEKVIFSREFEHVCINMLNLCYDGLITFFFQIITFAEFLNLRGEHMLSHSIYFFGFSQENIC